MESPEKCSNWTFELRWFCHTYCFWGESQVNNIFIVYRAVCLDWLTGTQAVCSVRFHLYEVCSKSSTHSAALSLPYEFTQRTSDVYFIINVKRSGVSVVSCTKRKLCIIDQISLVLTAETESEQFEKRKLSIVWYFSYISFIFTQIEVLILNH